MAAQRVKLKIIEGTLWRGAGRIKEARKGQKSSGSSSEGSCSQCWACRHKGREPVPTKNGSQECEAGVYLGASNWAKPNKSHKETLVHRAPPQICSYHHLATALRYTAILNNHSVPADGGSPVHGLHETLTVQLPSCGSISFRMHLLSSCCCLHIHFGSSPSRVASAFWKGS